MTDSDTLTNPFSPRNSWDWLNLQNVSCLSSWWDLMTYLDDPSNALHRTICMGRSPDWEMCCVCRWCCCSMQEVPIWRGESYLYCDIDTVLLYNSTGAAHNTSAGGHTYLLYFQVGISMIKLATFRGRCRRDVTNKLTKETLLISGRKDWFPCFMSPNYLF